MNEKNEHRTPNSTPYAVDLISSLKFLTLNPGILPGTRGCYAIRLT
jgi:hypothetical protein